MSVESQEARLTEHRRGLRGEPVKLLFGWPRCHAEKQCDPRLRAAELSQRVDPEVSCATHRAAGFPQRRRTLGTRPFVLRSVSTSVSGECSRLLGPGPAPRAPPPLAKLCAGAGGRPPRCATASASRAGPLCVWRGPGLFPVWPLRAPSREHLSRERPAPLPCAPARGAGCLKAADAHCVPRGPGLFPTWPRKHHPEGARPRRPEPLPAAPRAPAP